MGADATLEKLLRTRVAEVIAGAKAYDVPALCERLGLAAGDEDEAMRSKFKYAHSRLMNVGGAKLLPIAQALLAEERDFSLAELVAKIAERDTPSVSTLTRRRILAGFDGGPLCSEFDEIASLEQIWPLAAMPSVYEASWANSGRCAKTSSSTWFATIVEGGDKTGHGNAGGVLSVAE